MPIAKRDIVELLLARNDHARAIRADDELPELVHVERHSGLLRDLGLDPALLLWDIEVASRRFNRRRPVRGRSLAGR
jgi:hypothetical protein